MRKVIRLNYLLIILIFALVSSFSIVVFNTQTYSLTNICLNEGNGTEDKPYLIRTAEQITNLQIISSSAKYHTLRNKHFVLMNDITVSSTGKEEFGFCGILDGNNHTLTLKKGMLFNNLLSGGVVKNFNVKTGLSYNGKPTKEITEYCGFVKNVKSGARVENINATGDISINFSKTKMNYGITLDYIISGMFHNINGTVVNCNYTGDIKRVDKNLRTFDLSLNGFNHGGSGVIQNCTYNGNITSYKALRNECGVFSAGLIENCTYNGDLFVSCEINHKPKNSYEKTLMKMIYTSKIATTSARVFEGLSKNCTFNGDFTLDYFNYEIKNVTYKFADDNSVNFIHNGNVYETNKPNLFIN